MIKKNILVLLLPLVFGCAEKGSQERNTRSNEVDTTFRNGTANLKLIADSLVSPVFLTEAPDETGRIFIVDQVGIISVLHPDGRVGNIPFLDIQDKVIELKEDKPDERGLLGLAFHPDYANNKRFFVYYSAPLRSKAPKGYDHTARISEFKVSDKSADLADKNSEQILLEIDEPQDNHNGGTVAFGPDNYLYISLGDGGSANDVGLGHREDWYRANEGGNGQSIDENLLGSILRIDVDGKKPYAIPADNPFVGKPGMDEIYASGFRNPYRFSFDIQGGNELYAGDVGQELYEEVSIIKKGGNYGWNVKEATHCFDPKSPKNPPSNCPDKDSLGNPLINPVIEVRNAHLPDGVTMAIVGGYVYRGKALKSLQSYYVFGSWSKKHHEPTGSVLFSKTEQEGLWKVDSMEFRNTKFPYFLQGLGQDRSGEIYLLTSETGAPSGVTGKVFKLTN